MREVIVRLAADAEALQQQRAWGAAGLAWSRVAVAAEEADETEVARRAWAAAGEAWRRDDAVSASARALRRALALPGGEPAQRAMQKVTLSGSLCELGHSDAARELCEEAADVPEVRVLSLDSLISVHLGFGRLDDARALVDEVLEGNAIAGAFRLGQVRRMDGLLGAAAEAFADADALLEDLEHPGAESGRAAARSELAEVAMLQGSIEDALALYRDAIHSHERAGRRAAAYRAEAGRQRALAAAGATPFTNRLEEALDWAQDRTLPMLMVDLRSARGRVLAPTRPEEARADLQAAIDAARQVGARIRTGRALLYRDALLDGEPGERVAGLAEAAELLEDHKPWHWRAVEAHARLVGDHDRLGAAHARFQAMGMSLDAARSRGALSG